MAASTDYTERMVAFAENVLSAVDGNTGSNLFEAAVLANQAELVGMILDAARFLDLDMVLMHRQSYRGFTPLHRAVFSGRTDTACMLVQAGASTEVRDRSGRTPAMVNVLTNQVRNPKLYEEFNDLLSSSRPMYLHR